MKTLVLIPSLILLACAIFAQPVLNPLLRRTAIAETGIHNPTRQGPAQSQAKGPFPYYESQQTIPNDPETVKQRLDSILIEALPIIKTQDIDNYEKHVYFYNPNGSQSAEIYYLWNTTSLNWVKYFRTEYTYNANGSFSEILLFVYDTEANQWLDGTKTVYSYNSNNDMITKTEYYATFPPTSWVPFYKEEYTYMLGHMVSSAEYNYIPDSAAWINRYKSEYSYNVNGSPDVQVNYAWIEQNNQWRPIYKYDYTYGLTWKKTLLTEFSWDYNINEWVNHYQTDYTYNSNNQISLSYNYNWNESLTQWDVINRHEISYDAFGNQDLETDYYFDTFTSSWVYSLKDKSAYNELYTFYDLLLPYQMGDYAYFSNNMMVSRTGTGFYSGSWHDSYKYTYYYSEVNLTGTGELAENNAHVYPNPASSDIFVAWESNDPEQVLTLTDFSGKIVLQQSLNNNARVDLSRLNNGMYFYRLDGEGAAHPAQSGKICVLR